MLYLLPELPANTRGPRGFQASPEAHDLGLTNAAALPEAEARELDLIGAPAPSPVLSEAI
jgi:hypothetical protein